MHGTLRAEVAGATKIDRPSCRATGHLAGSVLTDIAKKVLWLENTAPCLAAAIGKARGRPCHPRTAERYLGGQRDWSDDALAVIFAEILRRHLERE